MVQFPLRFYFSKMVNSKIIKKVGEMKVRVLEFHSIGNF